MNRNVAVTVLGAGSWGATLSGLLADNGYDVTVWEFDPSAADTLSRTRTLRILPDLRLPSAVHVTSKLTEALKDRRYVVSAVPSQFVRATWKAVKASGALNMQANVISVSKGLEENTLALMTDVIAEESGLPSAHLMVLGGPSHAEEVCRKLPTATVVAGEDPARVVDVQKLFQQDSFRVYVQSDVKGVELASALKNVFAIASGISDGLGFGDNTRAALLTRALNEMTRIGMALKAHMLTFFGLAGMGDLIVTCLSTHSRNYTLGEKIGRGTAPQQALSEMTMVAEGYKTAPAAHRLAEKLQLDCPLIRETYLILHEGKNPRQSLHDLMKRETQAEWPATASWLGPPTP